jgi:hypothetical protein
VYLSPENSTSGAAITPLKNGVNGVSVSTSPPACYKIKLTSQKTETPDTAPPAYSNRSPSPEETFTPDNRRTSSVVKNDDESAKSATSNQAGPSIVQQAAAAAPSYEEIKAQLEAAQATLASYAKEGGLRMRKVAKGETDNETVNNIAHQVQTGAQGVPLQIVAALCLISFLLAYLLF